ncbi:ATP-binding protein [Thiovibrio frasassiensis]|uniref:histidine kinase n=1 Tax=Thiovibrio frasassiensis TaxID=2984131 RepID=A0A9X4MDA3_9BACT|nr:ATP-binding protein [Thiovibrio frasassiensis]MDG4475484.1 response regulator [Thiovibrio frasassiensis]
MDIRAKSILSVMLTITILTSVFVFMSIQQQNAQLDNDIRTKRENANFLAENLQDQVFIAYKSRIVSLATTKQEVIDAFARRDREALYQAALPFYKTIKTENPYFSLMHFHLPDNSSFLRMHLPELHSDDLVEIRPIIREVNTLHKQRIGYEVGKMGLFYRVVQPMFAGEEYIGALEFGISHKQLVTLLQQHISPEIAIAVKTESWQKATLVGGKRIEQGEYTFLPLQNGLFAKIAPTILLEHAPDRFAVDGKTYILFSNIELRNFQKKPIAKILVALDISQELANSKNFIIKVILLALFLLVLSSLFLYFSFGQLLNRIVGLNTSLNRSNQNLTTAKAYVDNILASMSDGLLVTTADGRISQANEAFCQLLGYSEEELVENKIFSFFESPAEIEARFAPCGPQKCEISKVERQLLTKDGHRVPVLFSATSLADQDGSLIGIVCIVTDITERKRAETVLREAHSLLEQRVIERTRELAETNTALTREMAERKRAEAELRQAQKMRAIGTLAGGIAHDFNNILTAIIGYTQLAMERVNSDVTCRNYLDGVFLAGQRAKELVHQILTFSRQSEQEKKPIEIHLIVKEALKLLRASLPANIEIVQDIPARSGAVLADPTQIHQIVMNLCTNAYHAMEEKGGTLTVSLSEPAAADISPPLPPGDYLQLMVRDTGCGMDTGLLERIFEPYFTTKEAGKGTGLGLAVTHGIVESHSGHIRVVSTTGLGTTFSIYLPLYKQPPMELKEKSEPQEIPGGTERILVVDDEREIGHLLELFLSDYGYRITSLSDSLAALAWFQANPQEVDLIITDMSMPHLTGKELAKKILAVQPEIPIILCTGFSEQINAESAKQLGIRAFLLKPFQAQEVAGLVRKVLDGTTPQS